MGICLGYGSGVRWRKAVSTAFWRVVQPCDGPKVLVLALLYYHGSFLGIRSWIVDGFRVCLPLGLYSGIWIPEGIFSLLFNVSVLARNLAHSFTIVYADTIR